MHNIYIVRMVKTMKQIAIIALKNRKTLKNKQYSKKENQSIVKFKKCLKTIHWKCNTCPP